MALKESKLLKESSSRLLSATICTTMKSAKNIVQIWLLLTFSTVFVPLLGISGETPSMTQAVASYSNLQRVSVCTSFGPYKITSFSGKKTLPGPCSCLFNNLPDNLKKCDDFNLFCSHIFKFLENRAQAFSM